MWALLVVLATLAVADVNTHRYKDGEEVILWVNKGKPALHVRRAERALRERQACSAGHRSVRHLVGLRRRAGDPENLREVRERELFYSQQGINAVPAVIIDERQLIQGGQPVEVFEQVLRQIARESAGAASS